MEPADGLPNLAARAFSFAIASIALGGIFGAVATVGMGASYLMEFGALFGSIVGLVFSPVLIFALRRGPWRISLIVIALPTLVAAHAGGLLTPPNAGPADSLALSTAVYTILCLIRGFIGLYRYAPSPPGTCPTCRYDRAGLAPNSACPECGTQPRKPPPSHSRAA
ncbi:hypothetical protein PHYC_01618 [Phycisphaerales bacterium]|nr:hypothetical protein PHYC_01618 [Phycisphaerales bacterium]